MKTILVPIDFSVASLNAVDYAAGLASFTHANILLLYVYDNVPPPMEIPVVVPSWEEIEHSIGYQLKEVEGRIARRFGKDIAVKSKMLWGSIVKEICSYAEKNNADLIVMGMQGGSYIEERLLGSITTTLMKKSTRPVLAVNKNAEFREIKRIVFATDGKQAGGNVIKWVQELVKIFDAHLFILHIIEEAEAGSEVDLSELAGEMWRLNTSVHTFPSGTMIPDINLFIREIGADMIVMVPRKHSILSGILEEAKTKQMAFHSEVPVLAMHE